MFAGNAFHPSPRHRQSRHFLDFGLDLFTAHVVEEKAAISETEHATPGDQSRRNRTSVVRCSDSLPYRVCDSTELREQLIKVATQVAVCSLLHREIDRCYAYELAPSRFRKKPRESELPTQAQQGEKNSLARGCEKTRSKALQNRSICC